MRKLATSIAVLAAALLALAPATASAAPKRVAYKGKTSGGHVVTFKLKKKRMFDFATGVPMSCLAIQGGGAPISGAEPVTYGWVDLGLKAHKFSDYVKPAFHYNEVTRNHTVTTRRAGGKVIKGSIRIQYEFLIPKFPIGTFTIYSCLGSMKFRATPVRRPWSRR